MKKYNHPAGYEILYDPEKFTISPNGSVFQKTIEELTPEFKAKAAEQAEKERMEREEKRLKELQSIEGKRLLVGGQYARTEEIIILEISPSGYFAFVMDLDGKRKWQELSTIHVREVLGEWSRYKKYKEQNGK